ncbi:hypothetical protein Angca_009372, partial [Angiostrongylus cantonensis]
MKEPLKFFRPWEDSIDIPDKVIPATIWQISPSLLSIFPSPLWLCSTYDYSIQLRTPDVVPPSQSAVNRSCVRCGCPFCVLRKSGKKPSDSSVHICDVPNCGKTYRKTSHLKAHIRSHIGFRPFACQWLQCEKKFSRSDQL